MAEPNGIYNPDNDLDIDEEATDQGCIDCENDFKAAGAHYLTVGSRDPISGNWIALMFPEIRPDRLRSISYLMELGALYDDLIENAASAEQYDQINHSTADYMTGKSDSENGNSMVKAMKARAVLQVLELDEVRGKLVIEKYARFVNVSHEARSEFKTLDEYMDLRAVDLGMLCFWETYKFGADIFLTAEENKSVELLEKLVSKSVTLLNDYFSWDKEYANYIRRENPQPLVNCVQLFMNWRSVDVFEAKKLVREEIFLNEERFCRTRAEYVLKHSPGPQLRRWLKLLEYCIAGNALWHTTTMRYREWKLPSSANQISKCILDEDQNLVDAHGAIADEKTVTQSVEDNSDVLLTRKEPVYTVFSSDTMNSAYSSSSILSEVSEVISENTGSICQPNGIEKKIKNSRTLPNSSHQSLNADSTVILDKTTAEHTRDRSISCRNSELSLNDSVAQKSDFNLASELALPRLDNQVRRMFHFNWKRAKVVQFVREPYNYLASLPSKGVRDDLIDGLNNWFFVPRGALTTIRELIKTLNNVSLMLDDIEDETTIRRGYPATHVVFGVSQTLNSVNYIDISVEALMTLFGRYYQIQDDYKDLLPAVSNTPSCTDLDQGNFSLPIIHAIRRQSEKGSTELLSILQSRAKTGGISAEMKKLVLSRLEEAGSLEFTKTTLRKLHSGLKKNLNGLEENAGVNWILRLLLHRLKL
ncbi:hypothetical protein SS1G_10711 [Sclerotinia sclerotiorum 1980 UF-70]|uniref:Uncharacterized protein n=1 Tax=Sclerotinia sclerotiorum (strain ATCC 18683 / 1980 / Ss-1) TaxID=665079 RepID=A7EZE4_SCLS1|nr:hypothetical protein SS1G_10711 [Sclerotinia sclerotiorum 1980 UF-70]EDN94836.1 hypothetical protein SS1G_10711 [Sclerotinia sclerotiorum 1980 UF-70]